MAHAVFLSVHVLPRSHSVMPARRPSVVQYSYSQIGSASKLSTTMCHNQERLHTRVSTFLSMAKPVLNKVDVSLGFVST